MKKQKKSVKLVLHFETVVVMRPITLNELRTVVGGSDPGCDPTSDTAKCTTH